MFACSKKCDSEKGEWVHVCACWHLKGNKKKQFHCWDKDLKTAEAHKRRVLQHMCTCSRPVGRGQIDLFRHVAVIRRRVAGAVSPEVESKQVNGSAWPEARHLFISLSEACGGVFSMAPLSRGCRLAPALSYLPQWAPNPTPSILTLTKPWGVRRQWMHTGVNVYSSIGVCLGEWDLVLLSFLPDDLAIPFWDMSEVDRGMRNGKTWEVVRGNGMGVEC